MNLSVCSRTEFGTDRWDDAVDRFDEAWLWHRSMYREAWDFVSEPIDLSFLVVDREHGPLALVPLMVNRYRVFRTFPIGIMKSVGGPAVESGLSAKSRTEVLQFASHHLLSLARRHKVSEVELFAPPMAPSLRGDRCPRLNPLLPTGCSNTQSQTWVVDLRKSEDEIRRTYEPGTRSKVKKLRAESFDVRQASGPDDIQTHYDLHCRTFARSGTRAHPLAYYEHVFKHFIDAGFGRALFLIQSGEVVATNITALYKGGAYYWFGASRHDKTGSWNRVLVDEQIMWARRNGAEYFEMGQAFPWSGSGKYAGISEFKKGFGSVLYPYFQGAFVTRPVAHAARQFLQALRREG